MDNVHYTRVAARKRSLLGVFDPWISFSQLGPSWPSAFNGFTAPSRPDRQQSRSLHPLIWMQVIFKMAWFSLDGMRHFKMSRSEANGLQTNEFIQIHHHGLAGIRGRINILLLSGRLTRMCDMIDYTYKLDQRSIPCFSIEQRASRIGKRMVSQRWKDPVTGAISFRVRFFGNSRSIDLRALLASPILRWSIFCCARLAIFAFMFWTAQHGVDYFPYCDVRVLDLIALGSDSACLRKDVCAENKYMSAESPVNVSHAESPHMSSRY